MASIFKALKNIIVNSAEVVDINVSTIKELSLAGNAHAKGIRAKAELSAKLNGATNIHALIESKSDDLSDSVVDKLKELAVKEEDKSINDVDALIAAASK